jgi:hypothetical protein
MWRLQTTISNDNVPHQKPVPASLDVQSTIQGAASLDAGITFVKVNSQNYMRGIALHYPTHFANAQAV